MMKKCPHCGEEYEDDNMGSEENAAHEANPADSEEDFGEKLAKAVVSEMRKNSKTTLSRSSFKDDE